jgi:uncharacterized protein with NRDE domain
MCLLLVAVDAVPCRPLVLLGNRDEFRARATAAAAPWTDDARVVGGRDLVAGGGWMAMRNDGRFAAVTNVRSGLPATAPKSRGWLVRDFVVGNIEPGAFLEAVRGDAASYGAFNLIVGDRGSTWAFGSDGDAPRRLDAGVHVVSNGRLGVHWPKTGRLARRFGDSIAEGSVWDAALLDLLRDETMPGDDALPDTGVGIDLERLLAPMFVRGTAQYGTRASTLAHVDDEGRCALRERTFGADAVIESEVDWTCTRGTAWMIS